MLYLNEPGTQQTQARRITKLSTDMINVFKKIQLNIYL